MRVLFVCTGNICRSPTADGLLRQQWDGAGDGVVDSAGLERYHLGKPPDPRTIATAKAQGVDLSALRARQFTLEDYHRFDLILGMDAGHTKVLQARKPHGSTATVARFLDYVGLNGDVPDPYYGTQADFDHVYQLIADGVGRLVGEMKKLEE